LGLAFLVDYLDPTVRHRKELEEIGLPVMGEIPRK
jgi:capsular polysaccharide biosynthesis protein